MMLYIPSTPLHITDAVAHAWAQECRVAKLFAKHLKVGDQQAALLGGAPAIGVGTPHRLAQLAGLGALRLERLQLVLVDVALDAKQRCSTAGYRIVCVAAFSRVVDAHARLERLKLVLVLVLDDTALDVKQRCRWQLPKES